MNYYNFILDNDMLTDGGYIIADNVLFSGLVLNSEASQRNAAAGNPSTSSKGKGKEKKTKGSYGIYPARTIASVNSPLTILVTRSLFRAATTNSFQARAPTTSIHQSRRCSAPTTTLPDL